MELGLSLGDANTSSSPKSFFLSKKTVISTCNDHEKKKNLGFCMALGINSSSERVQQDIEDEENNTSEEGTNNTLPVQLDLLPLVPLPNPPTNLPQSHHWSSDNGKLIHIYKFLKVMNLGSIVLVYKLTYTHATY